MELQGRKVFEVDPPSSRAYKTVHGNQTDVSRVMAVYSVDVYPMDPMMEMANPMDPMMEIGKVYMMDPKMEVDTD